MTKTHCEICEHGASYLSGFRCSLCHLTLCETCAGKHGCFFDEEAILEPADELELQTLPGPAGEAEMTAPHHAAFLGDAATT